MNIEATERNGNGYKYAYNIHNLMSMMQKVNNLNFSVRYKNVYHMILMKVISMISMKVNM